MRGANYILQRAGFALATIFFAITLNFVLFRLLPGTAVSDMARVPQSGVALKRALTHEFGLDKPKWEQYVLYLRELGHLNMGISFSNQQPVWSNLKTKLAATIPMAALGTLIGILLSGPVAVAAEGSPIRSARTWRSLSTRYRRNGSGWCSCCSSPGSYRATALRTPTHSTRRSGSMPETLRRTWSCRWRRSRWACTGSTRWWFARRCWRRSERTTCLPRGPRACRPGRSSGVMRSGTLSCQPRR